MTIGSQTQHYSMFCGTLYILFPTPNVKKLFGCILVAHHPSYANHKRGVAKASEVDNCNWARVTALPRLFKIYLEVRYDHSATTSSEFVVEIEVHTFCPFNLAISMLQVETDPSSYLQSLENISPTLIRRAKKKLKLRFTMQK